MLESKRKATEISVATEDSPQEQAIKAKKSKIDKEEGHSSYTINTRRHFKIWFSDNKDVFLPIENQLRFIRMREKNPQASLSFIYKANILSTEALVAFHAFCNKHNITAVDLDADIFSLLQDDKEQQLYELAQTEIARTVDNTGGSLVAASNIVRTFKKVLAIYGSYSDFDVTVDFSSLSEEMPVEAPLLLPFKIIENDVLDSPYINNEFLITCIGNANNILHPDTEELIDKVQDEILKRYQDILSALTKDPIIEGFPTSACVHASCFEWLLNDLFKRNPTATIFDVRQEINNFNARNIVESLPGGMLATLQICVDLDNHYEWSFDNVEELHAQLLGAVSNKSQKNNHIMYVSTVTHLTGPAIWLSLVRKHLAAEITALTLNIESKKVLEEALKACLKYALTSNNLDRFIGSENDIDKISDKFEGREEVSVEMVTDTIGTAGDASWSKIGKTKMQEREAKLLRAIATIQHAYRQYKKNQEEGKKEAIPSASSQPASKWRCVIS